MEAHRLSRKWRVVLILAGILFLLLVQAVLNYTWVGKIGEEPLDPGPVSVPEAGHLPSPVDVTSSTDEAIPDTTGDDEIDAGLPIVDSGNSSRGYIRSQDDPDDVRYGIGRYLATGKEVRGRPSTHCVAYKTWERDQDGKAIEGVRIGLIRRQRFWSHQRSWRGENEQSLTPFFTQDREVVKGGVTVTRQEVLGSDFTVVEGTNWYFPWPVDVGHSVENNMRFKNGASQATQVKIVEKLSMDLMGKHFDDCFKIRETGVENSPGEPEKSVYDEYVFCAEAGRVSVVSYGEDGKVVLREDLLWSTAEAFSPPSPIAEETCDRLLSFH